MTDILPIDKPMMVDIFVVAGNRAQYDKLLDEAQEQWKNEIRNRQVHFVESWETLKGIHGARVFCYGSYFRRRDWERIEAEIEAGGHRKLLIR